MKKHLLYLAAGIMTLSACTSEEVIDVSTTQGNAIGFENVVNKSSRAVEGEDLNINSFDYFLVYGYYTKEGSSTPIQIFNGVEVIKSKNASGATEWTYTGKRYWVPGCTYFFYAYSCADVALSKGKGNPIMTLTNESSVDGRALAITQYLCDQTHQHDLVYAENEGILAKDKDNQQVSLSFGHALCKIKAVFTTDFPKGYEIKISDVRIAEFDNYGDFNVGTGIWSNFDYDNAQPIPLSISNSDTLDNNNSSVETSEVFLIPKQYASNENVKLHFTIDISKNGETILNRSINGTWAPQWEKGRIYKYHINITGSSAGIEPIVFAASQSLSGTNAWDTSGEVSMVFGVDTSN